MITREDAQKFFSQDKVWGYDSNINAAVEGEPINCKRDSEYPFQIGFSKKDWYANCSLTDPRPKRVFEDGALYPARFSKISQPIVIRYIEEIDSFHFDTGNFRNGLFSFIGHQLPPELWEDGK